MGEVNKVNCAQFAGVAAEFALSVLTGRERAEAIAHLDWCESCRERVRQLIPACEELLGLLPASEPPAGFEARALEWLGLPAPGRATARHGSLPGIPGSRALKGPTGSEDPAEPKGAGARKGLRGIRGRPGPGQIPAARRPAPDRGPARGRRSGDRSPRAGPARRMLAAAAGLAIVAGGLGGWCIGAITSPGPHAAALAPLSSATLVTTNGKTVGMAFSYSGSPWWLYMSVAMPSGNETVTCRVAVASGRFTTIGSFRLTNGNGAWGIPDPGITGTMRGARLVASGRHRPRDRDLHALVRHGRQPRGEPSDDAGGAPFTVPGWPAPAACWASACR